MEEEDHDELLQYTDDDSLSDSDDQCIPVEKSEESGPEVRAHCPHTKRHFFAVKSLLILSSTFLVVLLPLYLETVNVGGDCYSMVLLTTVFSTSVFALLLLARKYAWLKYRSVRIFEPPISWPRIVQVSLLYTVSGIAIVYSVDRKRVMCHLQDPIKGVALVFSLLYYFFFCRKLMGLQRIFSTTTIIVGLFISVDYGLCDEFRCRGHERGHKSDDAGNWTWPTHTIWTTVYIFGLGLFTAYVTLFDRHLLVHSEQESRNSGLSSSLLSTVSRHVSYPNSNSVLLGQGQSSDALPVAKSYSALHLAFLMHLIGCAVVLGAFWVDFIPGVGKGSSVSDFLNFTANGFVCHFSFSGDCGYVSSYSWLFLLSYVVFTLSTIRFIILTQSAVYTVATMTASLPISGIWWSLFAMTGNVDDLIVWAPSITGELICAVLGLPIVSIGLSLLCKSHLKDCQASAPKRQQFGRTTSESVLP